jgi:hypothetical protein
MRADRIIASPWARAAALLSAALAFAVLAWWPMLRSHPHTPELDGQYGLYQFEIGRSALLRHGELPLWNPFDCRGIPQWDHPEAMTASPLLLATPWLSALHQYYLWIVLHCALGFAGMWLLARRELRLSGVAALVASCAWAGAASHTAQYSTGHVTFVGFYSAPLLLLLWRRAEARAGYGVGVGALLALMIYEGGTYPVPLSSVFLVLEAATRSTSPARAWRIVRSGVVVAVSGLVLSAARLLPLVAELGSHSRPNPYPDVDDLARLGTLGSMLALRQPLWSHRLSGQQYVWNEYIGYVGAAGAVLVGIGALASLRRRRWLLVVAAASLLLMLGHFSRLAPWTLLHENVFPFTALRVPSRFRILLALPFALWLGIAIDDAPRFFGRRFGAFEARAARLSLVIGAVFVLVDVVTFGHRMVASRFGSPAPTVVSPSPRFFYGGEGLTPAFVDQPRQNRAWLGCRSYEWAFHQGAPVWVDDVPQARVGSEGASIRDVRRTQNTFTLDVEAARPSRVVVNSAFGDGWRTDVGAVVAHGEMLAVDVPPGRFVVHLRYWPRYLTAGLWVTGAGAAAISCYFAQLGCRAWARRRRRASGPRGHTVR